MSSAANSETAITRSPEAITGWWRGLGGAIGRQRLVEGGDEQDAGTAGGQGAAAGRTRAAGMHQVDAELPDRAGQPAGIGPLRQPAGGVERQLQMGGSGRGQLTLERSAGRGHDRAPTLRAQMASDIQRVATELVALQPRQDLQDGRCSVAVGHHARQ